ncbi:hypothetical protein BCR39DRAFT_534330 [Naematelia encephala]|uniref:Mediator complex subunit 9 n=1 Tax=Naematelia encephala TaxID=71784 RepID=A0A1Y2B3E3_9TREE|nr:hypothetical protein BCR39DRAFT_534330 [Naematelia encephala]
MNAAETLPDVAKGVRPGTFKSLLPMVDELLQTISRHGTSTGPPTTVEASESVANKARELKAALTEMQDAALDLPGGHLSTEDIEELSEMLEEEAEKRRANLRAFGQADMPTTEALASKSEIEGLITAAPSTGPSPDVTTRETEDSEQR